MFLSEVLERGRGLKVLFNFQLLDWTLSALGNMIHRYCVVEDFRSA
jgi:hypothetical protein